MNRTLRVLTAETGAEILANLRQGGVRRKRIGLKGPGLNPSQAAS